ncbi:MAG TPA: glutamate formimidoyltransferase, partial [Gemmatimonadaceae bacterium]|nr:glutamate formimidoyltransferase [Gemmatimonadaceae bacterium]
MRLVECVPNFSEGRRPEVVQAIRDAIAAVSGVHVLDVSSDASHNRSVVTFVAPLDAAVDAAFAGIREARKRIDLTQHQGEHPRIGATDVVPFIPLEGTSMDDCIGLARALGEHVGRELEIPVFLYERAATGPERENLADIRRGEFEAMRTEIGTSPVRTPDFGPARVHPTAGATAIGARPFLVAYNVYLGDARNVPVAKDVARAVRGSSGGLRYVKALGLEVDGQAQVSMNLVDTEKTPLHRAFDMVKMEAEARGVSPTWSEIVGLVPERALFEAAARHIQLRGFSPDLVLERKVRDAVSGGISLAGFVGAVASSSPTPGGGSAAAHAGALGAALAQMVAGLTVGRKKYAAVDAEMREVAQQAAALVTELSALVERDAGAYTTVSAAYKLPRDTDAQAAARDAAITEALLGASSVPLESARACVKVCELALVVAQKGNANAVSDAGVAALLGEAACRAAAYNVRINVAALSDKSRGAALVQEARELVARAHDLASLAPTAGGAALGAGAPARQR